MPVPHEELSRSGPRNASNASNVRRLVLRRGAPRTSRPCVESESSELTVEQTRSERIRLGVIALDPGPYDDGEAPTLLIRREAVSFAAIPVEHDLSELVEAPLEVAPAARGLPIPGGELVERESTHAPPAGSAVCPAATPTRARSVGRVVVPSFSGLRWARLGARADRPAPRAAFSPLGRRSSTWKRLAVVAIVLCLACALAALVRARGGSRSVAAVVVTTPTQQVELPPPPAPSSTATVIASTTSSAPPVIPTDAEPTSKSTSTPRRRTATPAHAKKRPLLDIF